MNFVSWAKPTGIAADKTASQAARLLHYFKNHNTTLPNGVRPNPSISTMILIFMAFDDFGATLAYEG